ncbi:cytochrome c [Flavobacterium sp. CG_9.10]|uniref:c-type cytochrome n=1 Tax=Flavobacterium sp. CG_9.10 TaxID=2787729 RepID=UPI0018C9C806|nr:c-type cytochrome [Flavobacterium sp. CG_9.10]MBG6109182.1 cytochrome c [Flavobacterium sp. CG_9.10]
MKKLLFLAAVLVLLSCKKENQESFGKSENQSENKSEESAENIAKSPEALGKEIFEGKGNCVACHQVNNKLIGPSVQDIAKIYKEKNGNIIAFLKEDAAPLVDPSQYEVMKTNFALTEEMSDEELKGLEAYFYSNLK